MTYDNFVTAVLFLVLGVILAYAFEAWQDGREIAKRRRKAARERKIQTALQADINAGDEADLARATELVERELGGQPILTETRKS